MEPRPSVISGDVGIGPDTTTSDCWRDGRHLRDAADCRSHELLGARVESIRLGRLEHGGHHDHTHSLAVAKAGSGSGIVNSTTPLGTIDCGATCTATLAHGTDVTLTALPAAGSTFVGWSGEGCAGTGACSVTMTAARAITATFDAIPSVHTRYLAEGATSAFFDTRIALLNPGGAATTATLTFQLMPNAACPAGCVRTHAVALAAMSRTTVDPEAIPSLAADFVRAEFSTKVESDQPIVVDRTMTWDASGYGSHAETAVMSPSLTWYLAEGATHSGFELFYLLQNPNATTSRVKVRYLRPLGAPLEKTYDLAPNSRTNIWVDVELFAGRAALANADVSAAFE